MALHYFHMSNGETILDVKGTDIPDSSSVRKEAVRTARDLLNLRETDKLWDGNPWKVWVTDRPNGAGRTIAIIEVNAAWPA
jgi:hypothetical protein